MKTCDDCRAYLENKLWFRYCPTCAHCGARMIVRIESMTWKPEARREAWVQKVLTDWERLCGHDPATLRRMADRGNVVSGGK